MKTTKRILLCMLLLAVGVLSTVAQSRRPIDNKHPMWLVHVDVWNETSPQRIIELIPEDIRPYVVLNLSLSCAYDTNLKRYTRPQNAIQTFRSWASVCCAYNMWFTCQPASGGHTHIPDNAENFSKALEIHESFFKDYPNFLGWNYAEQFWGFNEPNDASSSSDVDRIKLFSRLVPMHHKYGGVLTISFCGNIWSHPLNPVGMMKRNNDFLNACRQYPEAILWLYKYTTSANWYNNESVSMGPFVSGLAKNYGVRYDNCGWNGAIDALVKEGKDYQGNTTYPEFYNDGLPTSYPGAVGIAPVLEQTALNGACVWDGPELIWTECFQGKSNTNVEGYNHRNWGTYPNFDNIWVDMFRKVIDGTIHIPSREEVLARTKVVMKNDISAENDGTSLKVDAYASPIDLYHGLYWQDDPFNSRTSNEGGINIAGYGNNNFLYFKRTGRYATIPIVIDLYDDVARNAGMTILNHSTYNSAYKNKQSEKVSYFDSKYTDPVTDGGDLFVARHKNALVCYYPFSDRKKVNSAYKTTSYAKVPFKYNKCSNMELTFGVFSSAHVKEYGDHVDFYLNNFRADISDAKKTDVIKINGASAKPTYVVTSNRCNATFSESWSNGVYTLNVTHCGPLDLRINCTGNNNRSNLAMVDDTQLDASSIAQPNPNDLEYQPLTIEAEDFDFKSIKNLIANATYSEYKDVLGHSAMGFAVMGTNTQASLRHRGKMTRTGQYSASIKYIATESGRLNVSINGTAKEYSYNATATSLTGQDSWGTIDIPAIAMSSTEDNTIIITNAGGRDLIIDNMTFKPVNETLNATTSGNVKYDNTTKRYYFYTPTFAAFIFDNFNGKTLEDCAELTINSGSDNTTGYRLDIQLLNKNDSIIKDGSTDSSADKYMLGTEDKGTRLTQMQGSVTYDLQTLFAYYIDKYPGCKIGKVRLNTVVSKEDTNKDGLYYITINNMSVQENHLSAESKQGDNLYDLQMYNYKKEIEPTKKQTLSPSEYTNNIGAQVAAGGVVYGTVGVEYDRFADLTGYTTMRITGVNGSNLRILLNRKPQYSAGNAVEKGDLIEVNAEIKNGSVDIDLSKYEFVHLNSIKSQWGSTSTVNSISLINGSTAKALGDFDYAQWDILRTAANPTKLPLDGTTTRGGGTEIYGVNSVVYYRDYVDLTGYTKMVIKGNGGSNGGRLRLLINRTKDGGTVAEGALTELNPVPTPEGTVVDLTKYDYVHLHSIKTAYAGDMTLSSIQLFNDKVNWADYSLVGAGSKETTAINALQDKEATAISLFGTTNVTEQNYVSANPNCLFFKDLSNPTKAEMRNIITRSNDAYSSMNITLEDGFAFNSPVAVTVPTVSYTRNLTTEYATMALPFDMEAANAGNAEVYVLNTADNDKLKFKKVTEGTLAAGSVVLYRNTNKGETTLNGSNLGITADGYNIKPITGLDGWYTAQSFTHRIIADVNTDPELKDFDLYGISGDEFIHATKKVTLKPFRAFFLHRKSAAAKPAMGILLIDEEEENATSVIDTKFNNEAKELERYSVSGMRTATRTPGIQIIRMSDGTVRKVVKE